MYREVWSVVDGGIAGVPVVGEFVAVAFLECVDLVFDGFDGESGKFGAEEYLFGWGCMVVLSLTIEGVACGVVCVAEPYLLHGLLHLVDCGWVGSREYFLAFDSCC